MLSSSLVPGELFLGRGERVSKASSDGNSTVSNIILWMFIKHTCGGISVHYKNTVLVKYYLIDFIMFGLFHFSAKELLFLNINLCIADGKQKAKGAH